MTPAQTHRQAAASARAAMEAHLRAASLIDQGLPEEAQKFSQEAFSKSAAAKLQSQIATQIVFSATNAG